MFTSITVLTAVSAVIIGRFLSSRPALLDTPRLPHGARFTEAEAKAVAAVLRFGGLAALATIILATIFRVYIS